MSLDDRDPELIRLQVQATKGRSDFLEATLAFHLAIAVAVEALAQDLETEEATARFSSALSHAARAVEQKLSGDERDQFRRIYDYFREVCDVTWENPQ